MCRLSETHPGSVRGCVSRVISRSSPCVVICEAAAPGLPGEFRRQRQRVPGECGIVLAFARSASDRFYTQREMTTLVEDSSGQQATAADTLRSLIEYSRLLGSDESLVLRGGGNTSVKMRQLDFAGRPIRVLCIKGSGSDLASVEQRDFTDLRLDDLLLLRDRSDMSDEAMVDYLAHCKLNPAAARPSIETLLHAFLPDESIFHSHADAILSLTNTPHPGQLLHEVYGGSVAVAGYRRPGFLLSREVADLAAESGGVAVVLLNHGLVTWGSTPAAAYGMHIELVQQAREFALWRGGTRVFTPDLQVLPDEQRRAAAAALAPVLRGELSRNRHVVLMYDDAPETLAFVGSAAARVASQYGAATPDHILTTGVRPLWLQLHEGPAEAQVRSALEQHREAHRAYVQRWRTNEPTVEENPRVILVPGIGMFTAGRNLGAASLARSIYRHTMEIIEKAEAVGGYRSLEESAAFHAEHWPLELYKLSIAPPEKELAGRVALVTGAGSGIGRAAALRLADAGAHVIVTDAKLESAEETAHLLMKRKAGPGCACHHLDVTDVAAVAKTFERMCLEFGGVDIVISNAGFAHCAAIEDLALADWERSLQVNATGHLLITQAALRLFRHQNIGGNIVFVASKNVLAAGAGFAAYSAAKAAEAQLARVAAIEGGTLGVRVNIVNPDAVFSDTHLWDDIREARAISHGIDALEIEAFYRNRSLLRLDVRPQDVAEAILFLASERASRTTGCMLSVDAGVREAFAR